MTCFTRGQATLQPYQLKSHIGHNKLQVYCVLSTKAMRFRTGSYHLLRTGAPCSGKLPHFARWRAWGVRHRSQSLESQIPCILMVLLGYLN